MAENPREWTVAHHVIHDALLAFEEQDRSGRIGFSLPGAIYEALKNAALLTTRAMHRPDADPDPD